MFIYLLLLFFWFIYIGKFTYICIDLYTFLSHSLHFTTFISNHKVLSSCKSLWEWTFKLLKRELWIMLLPKILLFTLVICYPLASHYLHIRFDGANLLQFVRTNCCSRLLASGFSSALHFEKNFNSKSQHSNWWYYFRMLI